MREKHQRGERITRMVLLVGLALAFDFLNGFHDAANSIATVVSTGVLRPYQAVAWAASFNFVAFAIFKTNVAALCLFWAAANAPEPTIVAQDRALTLPAQAGVRIPHAFDVYCRQRDGSEMRRLH
jgi:hypothetical protein